jgi:outer membrane protein insertion porin family
LKITPETHLKPLWAAFALCAWLAFAVPVVAQDSSSPAGAAAGGDQASPGPGGLPGLLPQPAPAPEAEEPQPTVEEISIRIIGPQQISRDAILAHMLLREKMTYNQELIDKSITALIDTGLFEPVQSDRELLPGGGVRVIISLVPKNRVSAVVFEGNKIYTRQRLSEEIKTIAGEVLDPAEVKHDRDKLFAFYQKNGYSRVTVEPDINVNENNGTAVVTFKIDEGPKVAIMHINFVGDDHIKASVLRDQMKTSEHTFFISWITGSGKFQEDDFLDDLDTLRQYYKSKGYLDVDIPDDEVETLYPKPSQMTIVIHVHEGRQYHIGKITVSGNTIFQSDTLLHIPNLKLKTGDVFSPDDVDKASDAIRDYYGQSGYLDTLVRPDRIPNLDTGDIDLDFSIIESEKFYVAGIDIQGNSKTKSTVIVRELTLAPGDVFDLVRMKSSEDRLKSLGYFNDAGSNSHVNLAPEESNIPGRRNLSIAVTEGKTGNFNFGAGFDTVESFLGYVEYQETNFDLFNYRNYFKGGGENFRIRLTLGAEVNGIDISFEEPWLWERELDGGFDLFRDESSYLSATYDEVNMGFDVYLRKALFNVRDPLAFIYDPHGNGNNDPVEGKLAYTLENIELSDVTTSAPPQVINEQGWTSVSKVSFTLSRVHLDNLTTPLQGSRYELINEVAGGPLMGQTNFYRVEAHVGWWVPTFPFGNQDLSLVGRAGTVTGYGGKIVPYAQKYFLGGGYDMRGYSLQNVGPHDAIAGDPSFGSPLGGDTEVYASPEYSIELFHPVRFAVFYDVGYVNENAYDFSPKGFNQDVGFGIRLLLLGAPMRFDIGYPLDPNSFQSQSIQFNFSFGTVF